MAWDFAAEIHALSNFNADDGSGTGTSGEVLTLHANRWLTDGAKEVINILPRRLKEKCSVQTGLDNSATTLAMEGIGDILHVTRENADSGYYAPCRKIDAQYGDLANDSGNIIHYATATDPVYWIESSSGDAATLFVKPTPTAAQPAKVYHVSFPTVEFDDTAIANFPDEAEYLVVLYASQKALLHQLNVLQTNTDIVTALTATNTELDELQALADLMHAEIVLAKAEAAEMATQTDNSGTINTALAAIASELGKADEVIVLASAEFDKISAILDLGEADSEATINTAMALVKAAVDQAATAGDLFSTMVFENEETFKTTNAQITRVKGALDNAEAVINGDQPSATTDAYGALADEDTEIMQGALAISKTEIERAQAHLSEWTAIGNMVATEVNTSLAEANGYISEIQARLSQAKTKRDEAQSRISSGNAYIGEANAIISQANAYGQEASARVGFTGAKMQVVQAYMGTAQGYGGEVQAKIALANAYIGEVNARMQVDGQKYTWLESQYTKLKQEYTQGITAITSGSLSPQQNQGA